MTGELNGLPNCHLVAKLLVIVACATIAPTMAQQPLVGSETPQPAHLLQPRNFNPHPYQSQSYAQHSQDYGVYGAYYNYAPLQYQLQYQPATAALQSTVDRNPYNIIKGQRDYLTRVQSERDHQAFSALAQHAKKIQAQPQLQQQQQVDPQDYLNRKYAFEYSANDIYHAQQQDDQGLVKGSYEVPLPDGRVQIVQYTADANGYHPEISYKGEAQPQQQTATYQPIPQSLQQLQYRIPQSAAYSVAQQVQQPTVPIRAPFQRGSVVVYPAEEEQRQQAEQLAEVDAPKSYYSSTTVSSEPQAVQYQNYGLISGLPRPYGTVRTTVSQLNQAAAAAQAAKYGQIQYATYEDVVEEEQPSTYQYEQQ